MISKTTRSFKRLSKFSRAKSSKFGHNIEVQ
jgi:hypothetical protein